MSNSSSSSKGGHSSVDTRRKVAEMSLSRRFLDVLTHRLEDLSTNQQTSDNATSFQLEPAERNVLYEINNLGLVEGMVSGALTLVALRKGRSYFQRRIWQRAMKQQQQRQQQQQQSFTSSQSNASTSSGNPFHSHQKPPPGHVASPSSTPFSPQQFNFNNSNPLNTSGGATPAHHHPSLGRLPHAIGWMLDGMAAFMVCVSVSVMYTDVEAILGKIALLPLVEGHSVVARELCPPILQEVRKMSQLTGAENNENNQDVAHSAAASLGASLPAPAFDEMNSRSSSSSKTSTGGATSSDGDADFSPKHLLQDPQTPQLQAIVHFAENCQRRQVLERSLRRERGLSNRAAVDIPSPGVPADLDVDLFAQQEGENEDSDNGEGRRDDDGGGDGAYDFYDPSSNNNDNGDFSDGTTTSSRRSGNDSSWSR